MDLKIISSFDEVPFNVAADVRHEYDLVYYDLVHEISSECEAEGYPSTGSNFELRLDSYSDYLDDLWIRLLAEHGYIYRHFDDCI